jgi:signal transduction histidine kinase
MPKTAKARTPPVQTAHAATSPELDKRERELAILSAVAGHMHDVQDVPGLLRIALDDVLDGLGLASGWIFLGDEVGGLLHLAAARGLSRNYLDRVAREGLGPCLCREVFATGHRMLAHNTTQCPRMPDLIEGLEGPVAHACVPLRLEGRSRGVLNVAARERETFDDRELRFLETVGHQISLGIETARHREAEREAFRELKDAQSRVAQGEKMAALGTFASGLAHEVRNPLNSISLQLSRLDRKTRSLGVAQADEITSLTRIIREEVERLDALVEDFLLFARPNRPDHYETSLPNLVEEVVRFLAAEAGARGVSLETGRVGEPLPPLRLDAGRVKQVLLNLLRNAIEAMPKGGLVQVECGLVDGRARLSVHDTGPGLPLGLDIFQLFVTTKPQGTGLGLAIAQQIVLEHGGELTAENRPGEGASFTVVLPLPIDARPPRGPRP